MSDKLPSRSPQDKSDGERLGFDPDAYFQPFPLAPGDTLAATRDSQVSQCPATLQRRFAAAYGKLHSLPRGARRALQRKLARSRAMPQVSRELRRQLALSLAGAAILLALAQGVDAATIVVTTNKPDIKADGKCSIIEAIINANDDAATHPDCIAGSGADTIVLPPSSTITFSSSMPENAWLGSIKSTIVIQGNGAKLVRKKNKMHFAGVFADTSGDLTLRNVTMSGWMSGAIFNRGALTLVDSLVSGNTDDLDGGAIYNAADAATIIENSTISGNTAFDGGAIFNKGTINIDNSTISGNSSNSIGGGISNFDGNVTITNSTISGNKDIGWKYCFASPRGGSH